MSYFEDKKEGNKVEQEFANILIKRYNLQEKDIEFCKNGDYDILIISTRETYEIKYDRYSIKSKNIAIEYSCRNKESGIRITKAFYWVQKVDGEFYVIKTDELKCRIQSGNYHTVSGGDPGSDTRMYLIPKDEFKSWEEVNKIEGGCDNE